MKKINIVKNGIALVCMFGMSPLLGTSVINAAEPFNTVFNQSESNSAFYTKNTLGFAYPESLEEISSGDYNKITFLPEYKDNVYTSGYAVKTFKFSTSDRNLFYKLTANNMSADTLYYKVYTDKGTLLTTDEGGSATIKQANSISPIIRFEKNSTYYIQLYFKNSSSLNTLTQASLSIESISDDFSDTQEASELTFIDNEYSGALDGYKDIDFMKFETKNIDAFYKFSFTNPSMNSLKCTIYNSNNESETSFVCNSQVSVEKMLQLDKGKTYYVKIESTKLINIYSDTLTSPYIFKVTSIDDDYKGTIEDATEVSLNDPNFVSINSDDDVDVVKFNTGNLTNININYTNYSDTNAVAYKIVEANNTNVKTGSIVKSATNSIVINGDKFQKNTDYWIIFSGKSNTSIEFELTSVKRNINYSLNYGINNPKNPTTFFEGVTTPIYSPTRDGYTFAGWYANNSFTGNAFTSISGATDDVTLYAKWTALPYSITYYLNGGTNNDKNQTKYETTSAVALYDTTRKGYTFEGWYSNNTFTDAKITSISKGSIGNKSLYAKWKTIPYTIRYVLDGGTNSTSNVASYNIESTIILANPTKEAYDFEGWYTNDDFTEQVTKITPGATENKSLYAKWVPITYNITYVLNGGTQSSENVSGYDIEKGVDFKDPTRTSYEFGGWYTNAQFTGENVDFISKGSKGNVTLYAKWTEQNYNIGYELNGGTQNASNKKVYTISSSVSLLAPTRSGYTFGGWFDNIKLTGSPVTALGVGTTGDKIYFAKWTPNTYSISYVLNGGTISSSKPTNYTPDKSVSIPKPTQNGYQFAGWYTNKKFEGSPITSIAKGTTGNKTLYAKWTTTPYTINYHLNDGTNNKDNPSTYNTAQNIKLKTPTKTYYTFDGWYSDNALTKKIVKISAGSVGSQDVYAKWKESPFTIVYRLNSGTQNKANPSKYYITSNKITLANPTRKGFKFDGWYKNSKFKTKVTSIKEGSHGSMTLYAKWNPITYTIKYNLNGGTQNGGNVFKYNPTQTISLKNPSKKGYDFKGWYTSSKLTGSVIKTIPKNAYGNKTYYAKWAKTTIGKSAVTKLTTTSKQFVAAIRKVGNASGYQVQYATNKSFKSATTVNLTTATTTVKSLKSKTTYYVRVRAYKKDSSGAKVYSGWSAAKSIKVK